MMMMVMMIMMMVVMIVMIVTNDDDNDNNTDSHLLGCPPWRGKEGGAGHWELPGDFFGATFFE